MKKYRILLFCLALTALLSGCGDKDPLPIETDPPIHAPVTDPPETAPVTEPPETEPPETDPPETTAPVVQPPEILPPVIPDDTTAAEKPPVEPPVTVEPVVNEGKPDAIDLRGKLAIGKPVTGRFVSKESTKLVLVVDYTCTLCEDGTTAVDLAVGLQAYDINCGSRIDMGVITVDGTSKTFSTEALVKESSKKSIIPFTTHAFRTKPGQTSSDIEVSWTFNGVYGGQKLEKLTAGAVMTFADAKKAEA